MRASAAQMDTRQNRRTSMAYSVPCRFANMNRSAICNLRHNELLYVIIRVAGGARLGRQPPRWVTGGSIAGGLGSTAPQWPRPISLAIGAPPPAVACGQSWPRLRAARVGKETAPPVEQRNLCAR